MEAKSQILSNNLRPHPTPKPSAFCNSVSAHLRGADVFCEVEAVKGNSQTDGAELEESPDAGGVKRNFVR